MHPIPPQLLQTHVDVTDTPFIVLRANAPGDTMVTAAHVEWVNEAACEILVAAACDILERPLPLDDGAPTELLLRAARPSRIPLVLTRRDGSKRTVVVHAVPIEPGAWIASVITDLGRDTAEALATSQERFRILVEKTPIATAFSDVGLRLGHVNDAMVGLFNAPASALLGTGWLDRISPEHQDDFLYQMMGVLSGGGPVETTIVLSVPEPRIVDVLAAPVPLPRAGRGFVVTFDDVTEKHGLQAALEHQALHDPLTGLPNRVRLRDTLNDALARGEELAVAFVDLDNFKVVNDTLGHAAGDDLLITVAGQLQRACRSDDTVHRIGGDEFVVVARNITNAQGAARFADRLTRAAFTTVNVAGADLHVSGSIGVVIADSNYDADSLLQHADIAMYQAKTSGKNQWRLFTVGDDEALTDPLRLSAHLRAVLTGCEPEDCGGGELELRYQPIVSLPSGRVAGLEALLRWHHPTFGTLTADHALSAAAESGTTAELTRWVVHQSLSQLAAWDAQAQAAGRDGLRPFLTINVDVNQLTAARFVDDVRATLASTGIEPSRLTVELTETTPMTTMTASVVLHELRAVGVGLAIDDFGSGYSTLASLTTLPVTLMKLDKSLLLGTDKNALPPADRATLAAAIVGIGRALHLPVVAEGVTEQGVADMLASAGCQYAQGFLYARPTAAPEIPALLEAASLIPVASGGTPVPSVPAQVRS